MEKPIPGGCCGNPERQLRSARKAQGSNGFIASSAHGKPTSQLKEISMTYLKSWNGVETIH